MKQISAWVADDGTIFKDKADVLRHEATAALGSWCKSVGLPYDGPIPSILLRNATSLVALLGPIAKAEEGLPKADPSYAEGKK